jgi:hypothetical protein
MDELQSLFDETVAKALASAPRPIDEKDIPDVAAQILDQMLPQLTTFMLKTFKRLSLKTLRRERRDDDGFRRRNYRRWRKAFELLELMWLISEEVGAKLNQKYRPQAALDKDYLFEALAYLHSRSLLVTREVICLMHGGFSDGAMSRWRTLHELATTASFLRKHGGEVAHRYLVSHYFDSYRTAKQLEVYSDRANIERFSPQEIDYLKRSCDVFASQFGEEMREGYGWAASALGVRKPNFAMIEKDVGLDHWRPRYRWASQHTHGPHRPAHALLGVAETEQQVLLVGQSNSGMVDPLQMTAITLAIVSSAMFVTRPSVDHIVAAKILSDLSAEIGPVALDLERKSYAKAQKAKPASKSRSKAKKSRGKPRTREKNVG